MINGKKCDVFISYRRSEGWELARLIYESLKKNHFNPFLDIEGIKTGADWDNQIKTNLEEAKIFILIVSRDTLSAETLKKYIESGQDDWVVKEIQYALDNNKIIIPVLSDGFNDKGAPDNIKKVFASQGIPVNPIIYEQTLEKMYKDIYEYLDNTQDSFNTVGRIDCQPGIIKATEEETENCKNEIVWTLFHESVDLKNDLAFSKFRETILKVATKYKQFSILDVGCGNFARVWNLFKDSSKLTRYVGIDNNENWIKGFSKLYEDELGKNVDFWLMDMSNEKFIYDLYNDKILSSEINIESLSQENRFDIVVLKDSLRYVKDPQKLIEACKRALKPGGTMIIADVDDGLNFAYPDKNGLIQKFFSLLDDDKQDFGNRYTGRQVFSYLSQAKLQEIKVNTSVITNDNFNDFGLKIERFEDKIKKLDESFKKRLAQNPYDILLKNSYTWLKQNQQAILDEVKSSDFFWGESYIIYTAVRVYDDEIQY